MKVSVIVFPGTNCDHDAIYTYQKLGASVTTVWHRDRELHKPDVIVLPGGFAYGDYLRTGALAKISPVMEEVSKFAANGGPVIGICNEFQIPCETGLLPGVLLQNIQTKFLSQFVHLKIENCKTPFTKAFKANSVITCPVAHGEGNYFCSPETLKEPESNGQVVFRYCASVGKVTLGDLNQCPNGALNNIAGICNKQGNVVGLMPHPERAIEAMVGYIGGQSGLKVFESSLG